MHPTAVINVVGLTGALIGKDTPTLSALAAHGSRAPIRAVLPAVTCTAQATFLTGLPARQHGIVGNGWYFRDLAQVLFWRQSNRLVNGEQIWDTARRREPSFTCAQMFWWFNMYGTANWSATPRPIYPADGRKLPDIYTVPGDLKDRLAAEIGPFPFFNFWGPAANIQSSRWIAEASLCVDRWESPTLLLIYLPHLDYNFQRLGPGDARTSADVSQIDEVCGRLIKTLRDRGRRIVVLSEYGLMDVQRPIHINRVLRESGLLAVREELGTDALDPGACTAFAVADHQIAHIYVRESERISAVKAIVARIPGVDAVLDRREQAPYGLDHERSGELVAISDADAWFTYYYWLDEARAPDFARTVDIHRKPGYDPCELFVDPSIHFPKLKIAGALAKRKLGLRSLLEVIPLDASLVRGSHGRLTSLDAGPVLISSEEGALEGPVEAAGVRDIVLAHLFEERVSPAHAGR